MGIFFGDLHGHSLLSDGFYTCGAAEGRFDHTRNTPAAFFRYARDVAHLDFAALTDHVTCLDAPKLRELMAEADRWNTAARFVAFGGYEWQRTGDSSAGEKIGDHVPVYFPSAEAGLAAPGAGQTAVNRFCRGVSAADGVAHAAHPSYWGLTDWRLDYGSVRPNAAIVFTELNVVDGCYVPRTYCTEYPGCEDWHPSGIPGRSLQEGLVAGAVVGFVGESDSHDGRPGSGPLTGVWAETLERRTVLDALRRRRVFATSGARIRIEAFTVAGLAMGETGAVAARRALVAIRIRGTAPVASVELVMGTRGAPVPLGAFRCWEPGAKSVALREHVRLPDAASFWYVRVTQKDGQRAWGSPVWVQRN